MYERLIDTPEGRVLLLWLAVASAGLFMTVVSSRVAVDHAVAVAVVGTSLPELVVTVVALRRGQADIAIGDILGASLMDASL